MEDNVFGSALRATSCQDHVVRTDICTDLFLKAAEAQVAVLPMRFCEPFRRSRHMLTRKVAVMMPA